MPSLSVKEQVCHEPPDLYGALGGYLLFLIGYITNVVILAISIIAVRNIQVFCQLSSF